jgi:hypothetical protein
MSHTPQFEPRYQLVYRLGSRGRPMTWGYLLMHLREMQEDLGVRDMRALLRLPDPVERVR